MECKKTKFANEKFALQYIEKLSKTSTREVKPIRAYLCTYCGSWHLTSRETKEAIFIQELKNEISVLQVQKRQLQEEADNVRSQMKALNKKVNIALCLSNKELLKGTSMKDKDKNVFLRGANLMRELIKHHIKTES